MSRLLRRLFVFCAAGWLGAVAAQTLDDVELLAQGDSQVLRIRFNASVLLLQFTPPGPADFGRGMMAFELFLRNYPLVDIPPEINTL